MTEEEIISIEIPKSLYDRIDKFAVVEKAVVSDMTEWVEIMEDEERLAEKRFKVYLMSDSIEVINTREEDTDHDFVGIFSGISRRDSLLQFAKEGYGISEDDIDFVEES